MLFFEGNYQFFLTTEGGQLAAMKLINETKGALAVGRS